MPTVPAPRPSVNPSRKLKPLQPVNVRAHFVGGATRRDVIDGQAVLSIVSGDDSDRDETAYWCVAVYDAGRCVAFRLVKFGTGEQYDLPRDLSSCDCPDRVYRSERPGGCRHMVALRQALPTVTEAGKVRKPDCKTEERRSSEFRRPLSDPASHKPDRKTERDELSTPDAA